MSRILFFDSHAYEQTEFELANKSRGHELMFLHTRLNPQTAPLATGYDVVCSFVNDKLDAATLARLHEVGVGMVALRSAGFNHVDLIAAKREGLVITRVPEYSPHAVAEHAVGLLLSLNRKIHRAYNRVRELNFSLDGLVGFDLHGKTVGLVGTGRIGACFARIMNGFGCHVVAYDPHPNPDLSHFVHYTTLENLYHESDILSLHLPLTPQTRHLLDKKAFAMMKSNMLLINTGRGGLINTKALVEALKSHRIGGAALDVYEEEEGIFFENHSEDGVNDDILARLLTFPNVLITSHQAFLTHEALANIAHTTFDNIEAFRDGRPLVNRVDTTT